LVLRAGSRGERSRRRLLWPPRGFNARARAANFTEAELPELMTLLRTRGPRIPDPEHPRLRRRASGSRTDCARCDCSGRRRRTGSGSGAAAVASPSLSRVAPARLDPNDPEQCRVHQRSRIAGCAKGRAAAELSIEQIAAIARQTQVELEAFVHGACASAIRASAWRACRWAGGVPIAASAPSRAACRTN